MKNRRNSIVIDKQFQYQYSLLSVTLTIILINAFILLRLLFPGQQPLSLDTYGALLLGGIELFLIAGVWYGSLKVTHRIAGPIHVFGREIARFCNGDLTASVNLRSKDLFQPSAEEINRSFSALRVRIAGIKALAEKAVAAESAGENGNQFIRELQSELSELNTGEE